MCNTHIFEYPIYCHFQLCLTHTSLITPNVEFLENTSLQSLLSIFHKWFCYYCLAAVRKQTDAVSVLTDLPSELFLDV